jgi:hypothetical protein
MVDHIEESNTVRCLADFLRHCLAIFELVTVDPGNVNNGNLIGLLGYIRGKVQSLAVRESYGNGLGRFSLSSLSSLRHGELQFCVVQITTCRLIINSNLYSEVTKVLHIFVHLHLSMNFISHSCRERCISSEVRSPPYHISRTNWPLRGRAPTVKPPSYLIQTPPQSPASLLTVQFTCLRMIIDDNSISCYGYGIN